MDAQTYQHFVKKTCAAREGRCEHGMFFPCPFWDAEEDAKGFSDPCSAGPYYKGTMNPLDVVDKVMAEETKLAAERKKSVYIGGPITGIDNYKELFEEAAKEVEALGFIPLVPTHLPEGLTNAQYMLVDLAMVSIADGALFLYGFNTSGGANVEYTLASYVGIPLVCCSKPLNRYDDWKTNLIEVMKNA